MRRLAANQIRSILNRRLLARLGGKFEITVSDTYWEILPFRTSERTTETEREERIVFQSVYITFPILLIDFLPCINDIHA